MNKQTQTFSFSPPINLVEEDKWLLGVTSFECTNSVFNITYENNSFRMTVAGHWESKSAQKNIDELNKLIELRSLELHVKEVRKTGNQKKQATLNINYQFLILKKNEIIEELKKAKYNDLVDLVYRMH